MMGKKAERIAELEGEAADLRFELKKVKAERDHYASLVPPDDASPSLRDVAAREFREKWNWLLDAVGV